MIKNKSWGFFVRVKSRSSIDWRESIGLGSGSDWIRIDPHSISLLDQEPHLFIYYMCLSNLKNLQFYQKNSVVRFYHRPHFVFLFFRKYLQNSVSAYSTLMTIKSTRGVRVQYMTTQTRGQAKFTFILRKSSNFAIGFYLFLKRLGRILS